MYFPKNTDELKVILEDLQHFAQLEGMHRLSESLADARFQVGRYAGLSQSEAEGEKDGKARS